MTRRLAFIVRLSEDDARVRRWLAQELACTEDEATGRAIRLLGITYTLHSSLHGVVAPVADPRDGA